MHTTLYQIPIGAEGELYMSSRPRGGEWLEDEVVHWKKSKVHVVISLLEPTETRELELDGERELCESASIEFVSLPVPDRGLPPDTRAFREIAAAMAAALDEERNVLTHCRMGIGRAGMMATAIMIHRGIRVHDALKVLIHERGRTVPDTDEQARWLWNYAELYGP